MNEEHPQIPNLRVACSNHAGVTIFLMVGYQIGYQDAAPWLAKAL